jgi:hypothetical protein
VKAAGLDFRDIEQAVDQAGQMLGAAAYDLDGIDARARYRLIAFKQLPSLTPK